MRLTRNQQGARRKSMGIFLRAARNGFGPLPNGAYVRLNFIREGDTTIRAVVCPEKDIPDITRSPNPNPYIHWYGDEETMKGAIERLPSEILVTHTGPTTYIINPAGEIERK